MISCFGLTRGGGNNCQKKNGKMLTGVATVRRCGVAAKVVHLEVHLTTEAEVATDTAAAGFPVAVVTAMVGEVAADRLARDRPQEVAETAATTTSRTTARDPPAKVMVNLATSSERFWN